MVTKEELKADSQRMYEQYTRQEIQNRVPGASLAHIDQLWKQPQFQQLNDMLTQEINAIMVKHGLGRPQTETPQHVSSEQWNNVLQEHLQVATSKGVGLDALTRKQIELQPLMEEVWDAVLEHALEQAKADGVSETRLDAFRKDPQLKDLKQKFTEGVAGLTAAYKFVR